MIELILKGQVYLFLIIFVMMVAGMIKDNNLFSDVFAFLKKSIKSNRAVVALFSAITGCMPIKGRVRIGILLDTLQHKKQSKEKSLTLLFILTLLFLKS